MGEEFNYHEEQWENREDQAQGGTGFHPAPPNHPTPQHNVPQYYTPYPVYLDPFYRNCGCHGKQQMTSPGMNQPMYHGNMYQDNMNPSHHQQLQDFCRRYQYHLVQGEGTDGRTYDGIIEGVDNDAVYMLTPDGDNDWDDWDDMDRQYGYGPSGYGYNYGQPGFYGYPRRFRRFRRRRFPFFFFRRFLFPPFY
ncbi:hypothetical protein ACFOGI_09760 [Virgibacillus xinjiangensis]|uniref:Uncharacterized protein n=1 Tax=Virgibacillus xinjiangensis TaxID=393090 RepID=A0ABV7CWB7_9BACI